MAAEDTFPIHRLMHGQERCVVVDEDEWLVLNNTVECVGTAVPTGW